MPGGESRRDLHMGLVVGLFTLCSILWSVSIPPFEAPDETGHARYVNVLLTTGRLPVAGEEAAGEAHQPPLYYALVTAVARITGTGPIDVGLSLNRSFRWFGGESESKYRHPDSERPALTGSARSLHRLRLLSVLLGALTVLLVYVMGRSGGLPSSVCVLAAALAGFTPQFTFISASLNNDNLANLLSAGTLAGLAGAMRHPDRTGRWLLAGLCAGTGLLAKFTGLAMIPCGVLALALAWSSFGATVRQRIDNLRRPAAAFLFPALAIPAPLFWRNYLTLGDPVGLASSIEHLPGLVERKTLTSAYFAGKFPVVLFQSFWGVFGWMSLSMPVIVYLLLLAVTVAGLAGLLLLWPRGSARRLHLLLGFAVAVQLAQIVSYNLVFTQPQGRFLFPVIGPVMLLLCTGWREIAGVYRMPRAGGWSTAVLVVLMAVGNLLLLRIFVVPAYHTVPPIL